MFGRIKDSAERYLTELLAAADINTDGNRPWDIQVKKRTFFDRVCTDGSLGLGESYMDGWWECRALDQFIFKLLQHRIDERVRNSPVIVANALKATLLNRQNRRKAYEVGERHYDAGNELFVHMLDSRMTYSCGYWGEAQDLEKAQENKLEMICRKLCLQTGMKLLDIGCGWGSLVHYAAKNHGVSAVGLTVSKEQVHFARQRCAGLPVEIRLEDYRNTEGTYDAIVSVGMFEHVGYKNYRPFMKIARRSLKENGLFLLHTIASNKSKRYCDSWIDKYIFPNGMLPSIAQLGKAVERLFVMEDWHNIGADYDRTLLAWHDNFKRNWQVLRGRYSERFYRMWCYYLLATAGGFRARNMQVWQIVLSPNGVVGGYGNSRCSKCGGVITGNMKSTAACD